MGIRDFFARRRPTPGGWMLRRVGRKLDVDDAQQERLAVVAARVHDLRTGMHATKERHHDAVLALLSAERLDRNAALRLLQAPEAAAGETLPALVGAFGEFYDGLTSDQRARLRKLVNRRHGGRCGRC